MKGLLADVSILGQYEVLHALFSNQPLVEFWDHLGCEMLTFRHLGLANTSSDLVVWQACQTERLVLLTSNRNEKGKESLEWTLKKFNLPDSLPVLTLTNAPRFLMEPSYRY